ncbi:MAG: patatin-like phospholipase family protein [Firmicutes bacterium]|nr:patatin-like phospholipase family protein [Bacillota bacterium]
MSLWQKMFAHKAPPPPAGGDPPQKPKIGIAFGGGGLKGSAHAGVLKVLDEYGIRPDFVAGTSIGAAIAALYASGYDWKMIRNLFASADLDAIVKVRPSRKGLIPADAYVTLMRNCTRGKKIEEMNIPLRIVAVDLISWQKVVFDHGDTALAVRASSAVPGVFTPVKMDGMLLADGYLLDNCPGDVVREMGADIVIAISLFAPSHDEPKNILDIVNRSLDISAGMNQKIDADIVLRPIERHMNFLDKNAIGACFQMGEDVARQHIDEILEKIKPYDK